FLKVQVDVGNRVNFADAGRDLHVFRHGLFQLAQNLARMQVVAAGGLALLLLPLNHVRLYGSRSWVHSSSSFSQAAFSAAICPARSSREASQASVRPARRSVSATAAALASPQMPTEIFFTRPSILWSASIWMILACLGQWSMPCWVGVPRGPR